METLLYKEHEKGYHTTKLVYSKRHLGVILPFGPTFFNEVITTGR